MRFLFGLTCAVALGLMPLVGCNDNGGTGGSGGDPTAVGFAYVANNSSNDVSQYSIGADGTLTPLAPATVPAGHAP
jgi:6-phosphogluconolactonase